MNYSDYIKTYEDLARQVGGMVLANDITIRNLDLINGDLGVGDEIFQFYIISNPDFLLEHTDELVFYDDELHISYGASPTSGRHGRVLLKAAVRQHQAWHGLQRRAHPLQLAQGVGIQRGR